MNTTHHTPEVSCAICGDTGDFHGDVSARSPYEICRACVEEAGGVSYAIAKAQEDTQK